MNVACLTPPLERAKRVDDEVVTCEALNDGKVLHLPRRMISDRAGVWPNPVSAHPRASYMTLCARMAGTDRVSLSLFPGRRRPPD